MPELPVESTALTDSGELVEVGIYPSSQAGFDHGFVVLALGFPFWLEPMGESFRLLVESGASKRVSEHLAHYDRESVNWPPRLFADPAPIRKTELVTPLVWGLALLASFWAQGESRGWTEFGLLDARAMFDRGEAWRPLTALFLHDDLGHLISNLVSGIFVFAAVLTLMGIKRGWWLLMLAAVTGNIAAACAFYPEVYRSLGASTAVFAAVGLLTGRALRVVLRAGHPHLWRTLFVPFATGLTVLGLFGAGGQQVDVMAHLTGFFSGVVLGFVAGAR
jgi:rhomboid protease GluP